MSPLITFIPIEAAPNVVKHPIKAPGINHNSLALACQHIVADITPVIINDIATTFGTRPDIYIATRADIIPDRVDKIAVLTPSRPCLPEAKYAVHPAKPIQVTSPRDWIEEIAPHIPQQIPVHKPKANKALIKILPT